jgi:cell division protein ZipA
MQPLRWILLLVGVLFLAGLAWLESRRPRQASDDNRLRSEHREPTLNEAGLVGLEPTRNPREPLPVITLPAEEPSTPAMSDDLSEGVLGPARIVGEPAHGGPADGGTPAEIAGHATADVRAGEDMPALATAAEARGSAPLLLVDWPSDAERRILSLRLLPPVDQRFSGRSLRQALAAIGFIHGRFAIFHQPDRSGRAVLSVASLVRPGILDPENMDFQRFPGISVFAVLPGPLNDVDAFEHLLAVSHDLLERLGGRLQDDGGAPLDAARIDRWRREVAGTVVADASAADEPAA